jgi:hypothetical protein
MVTLLESDLPLAIYPCASAGSPFSLREGNTFCQLESLHFAKRLRGPLYRYARFAREKNQTVEPVEYLELSELPTESPDLWTEAFNNWELPIWLQIAGLAIKQVGKDNYSIVDRESIVEEQAIDGGLHHISLKSNVDGTFTISESSGRKALLFRRKDPIQYQEAIRSVLPELLSRY